MDELNEQNGLPELPKGWETIKLGKICEIFTGKWDANHSVENGEYRFYTCAYEHLYCDTYRFFDESIILPGNGANVGEVFFYNGKFDAYQRTYVIQNIKLFPKFLFYQLKFNWKKGTDEKQYGSATNYIRIGNFLEYDVEFPPLNEQARIVAKIEELFTKLDAGVDALKQIQKQIKRYRQAVLRDAVTGELTKAWREENQAELEPAAALLKRILTTRRERWEQEQTKKFAETGKTPKNDDWKKKYKEPTAPDTENLPELPSGWIWTNLGQVTWSVKDGPHYSPKYTESGIPFISGGNIRSSGVDFESAKFISEELHKTLSERCKPEKDDVLYTKGGTTGIARVNTYDIDFNVWVHVAVLKLIPSALPFFIQYALNSPECYKQSQKYTHGVGNQDLGLTRMVNIVFAISSLAEQQKIVEEVERLLSVADAVEATVKQSLKQAERLRQSILKRAFEGNLVSQDETDEPAQILLERIKREREEKAAESKAKKTKADQPKAKTKKAAQSNLPFQM